MAPLAMDIRKYKKKRKDRRNSREICTECPAARAFLCNDRFFGKKNQFVSLVK